MCPYANLQCLRHGSLHLCTLYSSSFHIFCNTDWGLYVGGRPTVSHLILPEKCVRGCIRVVSSRFHLCRGEPYGDRGLMYWHNIHQLYTSGKVTRDSVYMQRLVGDMLEMYRFSQQLPVTAHSALRACVPALYYKYGALAASQSFEALTGPSPVGRVRSG